MEHNVIDQAFPDIAENETIVAKMGRSIMGKEERWDFGVLTYLNLGRNMMSGGAYGKCRFIVVFRIYFEPTQRFLHRQYTLMAFVARGG
jgi:hypothetical protein